MAKLILTYDVRRKVEYRKQRAMIREFGACLCKAAKLGNLLMELRQENKNMMEAISTLINQNHKKAVVKYNDIVKGDDNKTKLTVDIKRSHALILCEMPSKIELDYLSKISECLYIYDAESTDKTIVWSSTTN